FNRSVGGWTLNTASGLNFARIFSLCGMSEENYSRTLIGWGDFSDANSNTPINVDMSGQNGREYSVTQYEMPGNPFTDGASARAYLTGMTLNWSITNDTLV